MHSNYAHDILAVQGLNWNSPIYRCFRVLTLTQCRQNAPRQARRPGPQHQIQMQLRHRQAPTPRKCNEDRRGLAVHLNDFTWTR
ncbi:unnamed protein product [Nippostrongylus brasiliensis]|uniref:Uncharacterized protein n=1 Tax=Nippostrongylus brasiliensis TaxID=27835 RepID=A0A0N4Y5R1_NIPBR|nr:unnamed protein product [Nippostrongylus brasiliensis]